MRIVEERHPGEPWLGHWLGNATAIDSDIVKSFGVVWLFKENDKWVFRPRITGNDSLYYNAVFFFRLTFPIGIFWGIRWGAAPDKHNLAQSGLGYKLNGRIALTFLRLQSDKTSAAGVTGPNTGQATGFNYGTH